MRDQASTVETTQAARAAIDMIVRDLRLGGACLPVTGDFISLDGQNIGDNGQIISRTGLTRPDLSCIASSAPTDLQLAEQRSITVQNIRRLLPPAWRGYIRHPAGTGEYFDITRRRYRHQDHHHRPGTFEPRLSRHQRRLRDR